MSPSGCLCLLTVVGLLLPTRGQTLKETISPMEPNTVDSHTSTRVPDITHPEVQFTPQISTQGPGETTQNQTKTQTQQSVGTDVLLTTDPRTNTRGVEGTTLSKRLSPGKDTRMDPRPHKSDGSGEDMDNPFFYDEDTLRKRGLLVAAVLFIMGIVILTSPILCLVEKLKFRGIRSLPKVTQHIRIKDGLDPGLDGDGG
ncbi:FXYD domain-containing ion transport regulator 5 isoform X2 [Tamandua tetradactyla]|uniref:FXYD domain-containing ion transport regulator 5 isoform X2 n=1 Tax=Tamandua tetradactyla TaxID=48850 RepID=UPI00405412CF